GTETFQSYPLIYHLDVGAMYPNIILTNRLQPTAIVDDHMCGRCDYCPTDAQLRAGRVDCRKKMQWVKRGNYFPLSSSEVRQIRKQLETEKHTETISIRKQLETEKHTVKRSQLRGRVGDVDKKDEPIHAKYKSNTSHTGMGKYNRGQDSKGKGYNSDQGEPKRDKPKGDRQWESKEERQSKEAWLNEDISLSLPLSLSLSLYPLNAWLNEDISVGWHDLSPDLRAEILKARCVVVSRRVYKKQTDSEENECTTVVCQRENGFYVDTVRQFRDRRYEYKAHKAKWVRKLKDLLKETPVQQDKVQEADAYVVLYESLQLAHKCILNSFYGYVMRPSSRWGSMPMAGAVTHQGGEIIKAARALVSR
ncbi:hypothetical protein KIPB_008934, partial [Kipferlia bialata]